MRNGDIFSIFTCEIVASWLSNLLVKIGIYRVTFPLLHFEIGSNEHLPRASISVFHFTVVDYLLRHCSV